MKFQHARMGILAALVSAVLLGTTPIFGKLALRAGMNPFALAVLRTALSALILWASFAILGRQYIFIYPAGAIACSLAGIINGLGSLMYYSGLVHLDASLAQLLYTIHPLVLALLLRLDGQPISRLTVFRMIIAFPAVIYLLAASGNGATRIMSMFLMLASGILYALHVAVSQRTLRDIPAPTVTLYTMTAMAITVLPSAFWIDTPLSSAAVGAWYGLGGLTAVTVLSRLLLFSGIQKLGGMQTALLGLSELLVSVVAAFIFFNEQLSGGQWIGALLLIASIVLVAFEKDLTPHHISEGWIAWVYGLFDSLRPSPPTPPPPLPLPKTAGDD